MKEKLKKKVNIDFCVACIIFILLSSSVFYVRFVLVDELWNFSNIYKMCNGYTIYKDINMITTPLFWYVGSFIFNIIGANYLSFRIYNLIIYFVLFYVIYIIFKSLKIDEVSSLFYTLIIYMLLYVTIGVGANYNCLAILFYLLGVLLNLKIDKEKWYLPYLQGVITFVIFFTKQNIGIYYLISSCIMNILISFSNKNVKKQLIFFIKQVLIFIIFCFVSLIVLIMQNNLDSFIDMCILGINEFAVNNITIEIKSITVLAIITISIIISFILIKGKKVDNNIRLNNIKILPFVIMCLPIAFPIFNRYHVYLASILGIVLLIYNIDKLIVVELINKRTTKKLYIIAISIITIYHVIFCIVNNSKYYKNLSTYINPYYGSMITNEQIENINKVCDFIMKNEQKGIDVKIISYKSNLYMNVLNKNNGILDLPFYGNLGKNGEEGIINIISSMNNIKILIQKDDNLFFQESNKVRNYIKQNLKYEGEIEEFLIYSK